jgi:hypothetical protein
MPALSAYQVEVAVEGRRLDVFVAATSAREAELLAWAHDDHYEVVAGATLQIDPPAGVALDRPMVHDVLPVLV